MNNNIDLDTNLEPAFEFFKSSKGLAEALGLQPMAITQWKRRGIPPKRAKEISDLSNGVIKPSDIKPKFFSISVNQ